MGSVVLVDQALKAALLTSVPDGQAVHVGSFVRIRPIRGSRTFAARLGLSRWLQSVLWVTILLAAFVATTQLPILGTGLASAGLGTALGGAGSNLVDQLVRGGIVDYVDLRVWPVFNLADVAIVAGVVAALAGLAGGVA